MELKDYMTLRVRPKGSLSIAGHLPVLAGFAADGNALFVAVTSSFEIHLQAFDAVADGTQPKT